MGLLEAKLRLWQQIDFLAFLESVSPDGAVGSKECWTWLSREEEVFLCAVRPGHVCARSPPSSLSAVPAEPMLVILVPSLAFLLSLAFLPAPAWWLESSPSRLMFELN